LPVHPLLFFSSRFVFARRGRSGSFSRKEGCAIANPVWVLSVDLQTKTASFQSGLADAAKSARGAFADIKSSSKEGGEAVSKSAINAQQALGVLTNALRGDTENAFADIIREMSHTSVVMAALPFAAAAGGALLLVNTAIEVATKIREWREAQEKLTAEQTRFGTAVNESFQGLNDRLLQAQQRADELRNDHLGALQKQLELIDHASMQDLVKEFETISKAADGTFKLLAGHWYTLGIGSAGATHALEQFKTQYDSLLSQGKDGQASDLLKGTRDSAERVLEAQKAMQGSVKDGGAFGKNVDYGAQLKARAVLQAAGVGYSEKETQAQAAILQALNGQVAAQRIIDDLKKQDSDNAKKQTGNDGSARASEAARNAAATQMSIAQAQLAAEKSYADARLTIQQSSVQQRLDSDLNFAQRDLDIKMQANTAEISALDKSGKDYTNQLTALRSQQTSIEATYAANVANLHSRAQVEQNQRDLSSLQQVERDKINATQQGSTARLATIDASIKDAEARNLQESDYYRQLGAQRVDTARQMAQDEARLKADAGRESADNALKMGQLELTAEQQQQAVANSSRRVSDQERVAQSLAISEQEFQLKQQYLRAQVEALDTSGKDYENKLKALNNKEQQLIREHENEKTQIQNGATMARNQRLLDADNRYFQSVARGLTSVLMGQQTFTSMMNSLGSQVVSGMMQNALMAMMTMDMTKPHEAAAAARSAYLAGMKLPFPANLVAAPVLAGGAFAAVMAFEKGGVVPGVGNGDIVPAMLTPGEGVVPRGVMDGLSNVARSGGFGGGSTTHIHVRPVYNLQALDSSGIDKTLKKHNATLTKHFHSAARRMNK